MSYSSRLPEVTTLLNVVFCLSNSFFWKGFLQTLYTCRIFIWNIFSNKTIFQTTYGITYKIFIEIKYVIEIPNLRKLAGSDTLIDFFTFCNLFFKSKHTTHMRLYNFYLNYISWNWAQFLRKCEVHIEIAVYCTVLTPECIFISMINWSIYLVNVNNKFQAIWWCDYEKVVFASHVLVCLTDTE